MSKQNVQYEVVKDEDAYLFSIEQIILEKMEKSPVIVFVDFKNKIGKISKLCAEIGAQFESAKDSDELRLLRGTMRSMDRGVIATLDEFGRGVDLRCKVDSFVIIGFLPKMMNEVTQMTGRGSRTMKISHSKIICIDKHMTEMNV